MPVPTRIYERGELAVSNVFLGRLDASMAALFAPLQLSPGEIRGFEDKLTGGGRRADNPLVRAALDLSRNPMVWIGLVLALGPYGKVADVRQLSALMGEGKQYLREVSPFMRGLVSPFTALRNLWHTGVLDKMLGIVGKTAEFHSEYFEKLGTVFKEAQALKVTPREWRLIAMYVEKYHTTESPLIKNWGMYLASKPLAPGLLSHMRPETVKIGDKITGLLEEIKKKALLDPSGKLLKELQDKGIDYVKEGYFPRVIERRGLEAWLFGGAREAAKDYETRLRNLGETGGISVHLRARKGYSIPHPADLEMVKDVFDPEQYARLLNIETVAKKYHIESVLTPIAEKFRALPDPHRPLPASFPEAEKGLFQLVKGWKSIEEKKGGAEVVRIVATEALRREGYSPEVAARLAASLQEAATSMPHRLPEIIETLAGRVGPARFTLDPTKALPRYIRSMGPSYAWYSTGLGGQLDDLFREAGPMAHQVSGWQRDMWLTNLKPSLRGLLTPKEFARRAWFDDAKLRAREWLTGEGPAARRLPPATKKWLLAGLEGQLDDRTVGGRLASMLYVSSLGLNMSPVYKNLFQNWITTLNVVGPRAMAKGAGTVLGRLSDLTDDMMKKGMPFEAAFRGRFPEYYAQFGYEHMLRAMTAGDVAKETSVLGKSLRSGWQKVAGVMMGPFAGSEKFNRLLAFYSTHGAALEAGLAPATAGITARNLTLLSQFGGGAIGIPQAIRNLPVPLRQFAHFPLRYVEWLYGSMRFGPEGRMTTGVLGRTMLGSTLAYTLARNVAGLDISQALAVSALPLPEYEESAFFPLPIVPPAVGIAGDILKSVATGEWGGVPEKVGAMAVPSGLALRRAWRSWSPKYADYRTRTPDGRIPVYSRQGYLIAQETPLQLILRGLGLKPAEVEQERAATRWLLAQREKLRTYRRAYAEAVMNNDLGKAEKIQEEFRKKYPELGDLTMKKSDLTAMRNRRELTRVQRILQTFPKEYRPVFEEAAGLGTMGHLASSIDRTGLTGFGGF